MYRLCLELNFSPCRVLTLEPIKEVSMYWYQNGDTAHFWFHLSNFNTSQQLHCFTLPEVAGCSFDKPQKAEKRLQSAMHLRSTHCGLNSVLDGTPSPVMNLGTEVVNIRHQFLRTIYGNSVHSPNLMTAVPTAVITVRRSPRFQNNV